MKASTPMPGPTGEFPDGKIVDADEGEIAIGFGITKGKVVIEFGSPVAWLGLSPKEARDVAALLVKHAERIEGAQ